MINRKKVISVLGLGYIGLPTAALLASNGYRVKGVDVQKDVVETINQGNIHIVEPELDNYVLSAVTSGKLTAHFEVQESDIYIICVPTPFLKEAIIPTPDISYIQEAIKNISFLLKAGDIVILESTSPVGTTNLIKKMLDEIGFDTSSIYLAYCPERVLPGKIMIELVENDRVIGGVNEESTKLVGEFYKTFVNGEILETDANTAEMCKLTENSFRDVNIAFANELSMLSDQNAVDVWELISLANRHPRVNILQPGTGVGGHCIAVDPWFLVSSNPADTRLIKTARIVNDLKPQWVTKKIIEKANRERTKRIVCFGLAFKPDIDDLRESPAAEVVDTLVKDGYEVLCVEPNIVTHKKYKLVQIQTIMDCSGIFAILVRHKTFMENPYIRVLTNKDALDFCGLFEKNLQNHT